MPRSLSRAGWVLVVSVLLAGCVSTPGHATRFGYSVDSPSVACRHNPAACLALYGKEVASASAVLKVALDVATRTSIDQELAECANTARSNVLLRHEGDFETLFPNVIECNQLAKNPRRKGMTWAMQLGVEMHEEAMKCAEERLGKLRPGGFNLEQRYRYDSRTGRWKLVSREEVQALEESGNAGELLGSVQPDVVIHAGDPLQVQEVYDFKFPCGDIRQIPDWNGYPPGHPYARSNQGQVYENVFAVKPARVVPRWGVHR